MTMKRILTILAAIVCLCACEQKDGDWKPMKLDKQELTFTSEGGEQVVTVTNYSGWWISGAYNDNNRQNYIYPTSTDGEEAYTYDILDGGWYHVTVPNKVRSNTVVITVDPNDTAKPRTAVIDMTAGDVFTQISVAQN